MGKKGNGKGGEWRRWGEGKVGSKEVGRRGGEKWSRWKVREVSRGEIGRGGGGRWVGGGGGGLCVKEASQIQHNRAFVAKNDCCESVVAKI